MKHWKEAGALAGVLVLMGMVFVLGSRDDEAEAKPEKPTTTTTTIKNIDSVAEGPYQEELLELAGEFDLSPYDGDWNFSTILGEQGNTIRVKTGKGIVSLYSGTGGLCSGAPQDFMPLMSEPGDAIVWHGEEDLVICPGEIFVVATAEEIKELGNVKD